MKRLVAALAVIALVALAVLIVKRHGTVSQAHAVEADADTHENSITFSAPKPKHRLPALPSFKDIAIDSVPVLHFTEAKREGMNETTVSMRGREIAAFSDFIKNNNVTPQQERLLMALIADVEDDIHAAKGVEADLRHGPIRIPRATYDKLGPEKTKELVQEEHERRLNDAKDLSDSSRDAMQADFDARAQTILSEDQFFAWRGYDLRFVSTLDSEGPFIATEQP